MVLVSIIIPMFNSSKYINECLTSILRQTFIENLEIICVDDGSSDDTVDIVKGFDKRIRVIEQVNQGAGAARNIGLKESSGDYCMFVDSDDYLPYVDTIEKLYSAAEKNKADITTGNFVRLYKNRFMSGIEAGFCWHSKLIEREYNKEEFCYPGIHWSCLFKKKFLTDNKVWYPKYLRGQDVPFCAKAILEAKKIYAIEDVVYVYRFLYKETAFDAPRTQDLLEAIIETIDLCQTHKCWEKTKEELLLCLKTVAMKRWYKSAGKNDWKTIDDINLRLRRYYKENVLLSDDDWEDRTRSYYQERIRVGLFRMKNKLRRTINYVKSVKSLDYDILSDDLSALS